jgi:hypothetical protein
MAVSAKYDLHRVYQMWNRGVGLRSCTLHVSEPILENCLGLGGLLAFYLLLEPQVTNITSFKLFQPWRSVFMTAYHPVIDDITVNNFGTCI